MGGLLEGCIASVIGIDLSSSYQVFYSFTRGFSLKLQIACKCFSTSLSQHLASF